MIWSFATGYLLLWMQNNVPFTLVLAGHWHFSTDTVTKFLIVLPFPATHPWPWLTPFMLIKASLSHLTNCIDLHSLFTQCVLNIKQKTAPKLNAPVGSWSIDLRSQSHNKELYEISCSDLWALVLLLASVCRYELSLYLIVTCSPCVGLCRFLNEKIWAPSLF